MKLKVKVVIVLLALISISVFILDIKYETNMINAYLSIINYDDSIYYKSNNIDNRRILLDKDKNAVCVIVKTSMFNRTIHGVDEYTPISYTDFKQCKFRQLEIEKHIQNDIVYKGQYDKNFNWEPTCAKTCLLSILEILGDYNSISKLDSVLNTVPDIDLGISGNELLEVLRELGISAELKFRSDISTKDLSYLLKDHYIIGGFKCNGVAHAEVIYSVIKIGNRYYYELMNPMGRTQETQYSLVGNTLNNSIDTRYFKSTDEYRLSYIIMIDKAQL